jgi:hypothetical protein
MFDKTKNILFILSINLFCIVVYSQKNFNNQLKFSESKTNIIPLEDRSRRKFDNAVIADLDQDGYLDLLLTEHARRVEVFWNNKGTFVQGKPFILGDTHGIAVGDYNQDGIIDILVQPGGGNGGKPSRTIAFHVNTDRSISGGEPFSHFEGSRGRAVKFIDINKDGKLDLVTSAFPGGTKLNHAHFLYGASKELQFEFLKYLPTGDAFNMRTLVTDFNNDNVADVLFYGGERIIAIKGTGTNDFKEVTEEVLGAIAKTSNVSSVSEIDFDNDGDMDLFITRSKEPFGSESDYDEEHKTFYFFDRNKHFVHDGLKIAGDLKIENLQMAFPDFNVYIGENKRLFERKQDKHGSHDFTVTQEEAKGWPADISKKGLYIGYLGDGNWRIEGDTESPTSAVLHNVIAKPTVSTLENMPAILLENRNGVFADVTSNYSINIPEQTTSSAVGDFNNDGWADIFVMRYGNPSKATEQIMYLNQGGKKFLRSESIGLITTELGSNGIGADAFDYDMDGDLDIICANERGKWHLFTNNNKSGNNYIEVNVGNSPSGKATAMGAVLTFEACNNKYKRVVGATSASYSQSFNTYLHVGLGKCEQVKNAMVTWSNGEKLSFKINDLNKIYRVGKTPSNKKL